MWLGLSVARLRAEMRLGIAYSVVARGMGAPGRRWSNATGPWARRRSRRAPGNHQPPSKGVLAARGSSLARCRLVAVVSRHCQRWRTSCPAAHAPPPSTCLLRAPRSRRSAAAPAGASAPICRHNGGCPQPRQRRASKDQDKQRTRGNARRRGLMAQQLGR